MIYGYCRVSTKGQLENHSIEDQEREIRKRYADAEIIIGVYSSFHIRLKFAQLLERVQAGDLIVVTKLDRFCSSTKEGLAYIDQPMERKARVHILNMGLIEDTPMGRLIITNLLAFAEFERAVIIERTQSGKAIAKTKESFKEGRPKKFTEDQLGYALELLKTHSYSKIVEMTKISKSTLMRKKRKKRQADEKQRNTLTVRPYFPF